MFVIMFMIMFVIMFMIMFVIRPDRQDLVEKYDESYREFKKMAKKKVIDDNPMLALKEIVTDRAGEEEAQKISLRFIAFIRAFGLNNLQQCLCENYYLAGWIAL